MAKKWLLLHLKQLLQQEGLFTKDSMKQLEPLLMQLDVQDLREGLEAPRKFIDSVKKKGSKFAFNLISEQLRSQFEDELPEGIAWRDLEESLTQANITELEGLQTPEDFMKHLVEGSGPLAIKFAIAKAKPEIESHFRCRIAWSDVQNVLLEYFSGANVQEALEKISNPKELVQSITLDQQVGKKWLLAQLRSSLEHLTDLPWNEVVPVLEELELAELSNIWKDPEGQALRSYSWVHVVCSVIDCFLLWVAFTHTIVDNFVLCSCPDMFDCLMLLSILIS